MESFDKIWEEIHSTYGWGKYPSENVIRFCARNFYKVSPRSNVKILDFGCGGGSNTWYMAREGFSTYAFDGSESAIKNTEMLLDRDGLSADLRVLDGINIDYESDFVDAVVDNACTYSNTLENILKMYKGCYRVLKHGGKFYTCVFSVKTKGYGTGIEIEPDTFKDITEGRLEGRGVIHFYKKEDINNILIDCGFDNIKINEYVYEDDGDQVGMYIITGEKK